MPGVLPSALIDAIQASLNDEKPAFETTFKYQRYPAIRRWFTQGRQQSDGGEQLRRLIQLDNSGNAVHVLPYETLNSVATDTLSELLAPWVKVHKSMVYSKDELDRNSGAARIVELTKVKRTDCYKGIANEIEEKAWRPPQNTTDARNPYGLFYWLSKRETASTGIGFDGRTIRFSDGTTTATSKGGIDGATKDQWRNLAATYTSINDEFGDTVTKMMTLLNFQPPDVPSMDGSMGMQPGPSMFSIYAGIDEHTEMYRRAKKDNDNFGPDWIPFNGSVMVNRIMVEYSPQLDSDAHDSVVFVNHNHFFPVVLRDEWLNEYPPMVDRDQPDVFVVHVFCKYQILCDNVKHGGAVLHKVVA